jgi:hypothetical protein
MNQNSWVSQCHSWHWEKIIINWLASGSTSWSTHWQRCSVGNKRILHVSAGNRNFVIRVYRQSMCWDNSHDSPFHPYHLFMFAISNHAFLYMHWNVSSVSKLDSDLPDVFTFANLYLNTTSAVCYRRTGLVCWTSETSETRIPDSTSPLQTKAKGKVPVHDTKAHEGSRSITLPILSFSIRWIKVVNFMPLKLLPSLPTWRT